MMCNVAYPLYDSHVLLLLIDASLRRESVYLCRHDLGLLTHAHAKLALSDKWHDLCTLHTRFCFLTRHTKA